MAVAAVVESTVAVVDTPVAVIGKFQLARQKERLQESILQPLSPLGCRDARYPSLLSASLVAS
jgi:hypothetical protein